MAVRNIVKIDEAKCNGCGQCITLCAEGALQIIDGKARLVSETYCDGLGACLGSCPQDAITIQQREAESFDEAAVQAHVAAAGHSAQAGSAPACPSLKLEMVQPAAAELAGARASCPPGAAGTAAPPEAGAIAEAAASQLRHWPVQLTLVRPEAPFLRDADLLLAADCAPLALADFHQRLLRGRAIVMGCPKLDDRQSYIEKLSAIFQQAGLRSLTIVHMEVPCCGGLNYIVQMALKASGCKLPVKEITVGIRGQVIGEVNWQSR